MGKSKKPPKWADVYPQGTKEGDEEQKFFIALGRDKMWEWRSVAHLAKETNLTELRIEELLDKYQRKGMVFQSPKNEVYWGYWERVPQMLPEDEPTVVEKDQNGRLKKAMGCGYLFSKGLLYRSSRAAKRHKGNKQQTAAELIRQALHHG